MKSSLKCLLFMACFCASAPGFLPAKGPAPAIPVKTADPTVAAKPAELADLTDLRKLGAGDPALLQQRAGDEVVLEDRGPRWHRHDGYGYGYGLGALVLLVVVVVVLVLVLA